MHPIDLSPAPYIRSISALLVGAVLVYSVGCTSSGHVASDAGMTEVNTTSTEIEAKLRSAADRWDGAPHEWGGMTRRGVDCSGLVYSVFDEHFRVSLPRTTERQAHAGDQVERSALQPGDLLFFRPEHKKRHVGIYLSQGEFLHASASTGVTISKLDRSYWQDYWWQARRVLKTDEPSPRATADSTTSTTTPDGVGW